MAVALLATFLRQELFICAFSFHLQSILLLILFYIYAPSNNNIWPRAYGRSLTFYGTPLRPPPLRELVRLCFRLRVCAMALPKYFLHLLRAHIIGLVSPKVCTAALLVSEI